ncbi:MAG: 4Fe-4S binding protein [Chrysiogenetes bacterium]|nr:4Fe-4S binding protein [Chrysiogenetes bacterium]
MAYNINDECINCGSCEFECSFGAISEGKDKHLIDPERCRECSSCAQICPVKAIELVSELGYYLVGPDTGYTLQ